MLIATLFLFTAHVDVDRLNPEALQKISKEHRILKKEMALHNTFLSMLDDANEGRGCTSVHFDKKDEDLFIYVRTQLFNFKFNMRDYLNETGYWLQICWKDNLE